ncbi:hypothetical protein SALBM311S_06426 [Streptomyces alboniger]
MGAAGSAEGHSAKTAGAPGVSQTSAVGKPVSFSLAASQSALRRTSGAWSGWADTDGMRSHSARSSRKTARCCSMYVRTALTALSTGWLMVTSLSARSDILVVRFLTPGLLQKEPLQCRAVGQPVGAYDLSAAHIEEGRRDRFQGDALLLGPG